jgi:hypothetical protein
VGTHLSPQNFANDAKRRVGQNFVVFFSVFSVFLSSALLPEHTNPVRTKMVFPDVASFTKMRAHGHFFFSVLSIPIQNRFIFAAGETPASGLFCCELPTTQKSRADDLTQN